MYFIAKLHPNPANAGARNYKGNLFTADEKKRAIREFYTFNEVIPLCIDHCGAETCGFVVPDQERIGAVRDLFNNERGELMVVLKLDEKHPAFKQINRGLWVKKQPWGVSVWIDRYQSGRKKLSHVALTTDPHFANYDTFLDKWAVEEWAIDSEVYRSYYKKGRGQCFASTQFVKKMTDAIKRPRPSVYNMATQQQQQQFDDVEGDYPEEAVEQMEEQQQPVEQQEVTPAKKTVNNVLSDGNNRAQKRRKGDNGGSQSIDAVTGKPLEMKPLSEIDLAVFLDVKQQYDIYTAFMDNADTPYSQIPLEYKTTLRKLENTLEQLRQPALQQIKVLEEAKLMEKRAANQWRCDIENPAAPAEALDRVVSFVACANRYHDNEKRSLRDENTKLQEELKKKEELVSQFQARQQQAPKSSPMPSRVPAPPQKTMAKKNAMVNLLGLGTDDVTTRTVTMQTTSRQPAQYDKWISNGNARDPSDYNMTADMAGVASFFGGLFDNRMGESS